MRRDSRRLAAAADGRLVLPALRNSPEGTEEAVRGRLTEKNATRDGKTGGWCNHVAARSTPRPRSLMFRLIGVFGRFNIAGADPNQRLRAPPVHKKVIAVIKGRDRRGRFIPAEGDVSGTPPLFLNSFCQKERQERKKRRSGTEVWRPGLLQGSCLSRSHGRG